MFIIAAFVLAPAQENETDQPVVVLTERQAAALIELEQADRAYRDDKFSLARRHAEKAFDLDPENKDGLIIIARSIKALYRDDDESPANINRARDAIAAYLRASSDPNNYEVYNEVKELYGDIRENDLKYAWIVQRATNSNLSAEERAAAYSELALLDLHSARETITKLREELLLKEAVAVDRKDPNSSIKYEIAQGHEVGSRGLQMAQQAVALDPERDDAWAYQVELLQSIATLSDIEGDNSLAEGHRNLARAVALHSAKLKSQREAAALARIVKIDCEAICDRIIKTPLPTYPQIAKTSRTSGEVVVQLEIDDKGNLVSATVFSGHPLLRAAALQAARQSTFSPIRPSGNPITTFGSLIYKFTLPEPIPIDIS